MIKACEVCGDDFSIRPYRATTARFCSPSCSGKGRYAQTLGTITERPWLVGNSHRANQPPANAFQPGNSPWNKGLTGIHLSPDTEFKVGRVRDSDSIYTVRLRKHRGVVRAWVKVGMPNIWQLRAVFNYRNAHGAPIELGMVVHHVDHNPLNDDIQNLQLLTRAEHIAIHRGQLNEGRAPRP